MSESLRIGLPTNQDLGLAEISLLDNPANYPVAPPELPGRSDDVLRQAAEDKGDWDLYTTHGIHQDPLPYSALRNRFRDDYHGATVDEPGGFIKAVLQMQRTIPTAQEYAASLAESGLIQPREVAALPENLGDVLTNTEEGADRARAYFKVWYLANAIVPDLRTPKLAAQYASDRMTSVSDGERARRRATELISQARGIGDEELRVVMGGLSSSKRLGQDDRLRGLGIPNDLVAQLGDAPKPDLFLPRFNSAHSIVDNAFGSWSIGSQVAYRQFFGAQNLVELATTHAAVEKPFDDTSIAYSKKMIGAGLAGTNAVQSVLDAETPFESMFLNKTLASALGVPEQMAVLGALASFMMREPALNGRQRENEVGLRSDVLGSHIVSMVTADYRVWLDQRMDQERRASQ